MSKKHNRFQREILEVCEFYVDEENNPCSNIIYKKSLDGSMSFNNPTQHLRDYCSIQGVELGDDPFHLETERQQSTEVRKNPLEESPTNLNSDGSITALETPVENTASYQQAVEQTTNEVVENQPIIQQPQTESNVQTSQHVNNISNITSIDILDF